MMNQIEAGPLPSVGRLFGDGIQHLLDHPKGFWFLGGLTAAALGALEILHQYMRTDSRNDSVAVFIAYSFCLHRWLRVSLYADLKERDAAEARVKKGRRGSTPGWSWFLTFCAAFAVAGSAITFFLAILLDTRLGARNDPLAMFVVVMLSAPPSLLLTTAFFSNWAHQEIEWVNPMGNAA